MNNIWKKEVDDKDYIVSKNYMLLHFDESTCDEIIKNLKYAKLTTQKAKDVLRASRLAITVSVHHLFWTTIWKFRANWSVYLVNIFCSILNQK